MSIPTKFVPKKSKTGFDKNDFSSFISVNSFQTIDKACFENDSIHSNAEIIAKFQKEGTDSIYKIDNSFIVKFL